MTANENKLEKWTAKFREPFTIYAEAKRKAYTAKYNSFVNHGSLLFPASFALSKIIGIMNKKFTNKV